MLVNGLAKENAMLASAVVQFKQDVEKQAMRWKVGEESWRRRSVMGGGGMERSAFASASGREGARIRDAVLVSIWCQFVSICVNLCHFLCTFSMLFWCQFVNVCVSLVSLL